MVGGRETHVHAEVCQGEQRVGRPGPVRVVGAQGCRGRRGPPLVLVGVPAAAVRGLALLFRRGKQRGPTLDRDFRHCGAPQKKRVRNFSSFLFFFLRQSKGVFIVTDSLRTAKRSSSHPASREGFLPLRTLRRLTIF